MNANRLRRLVLALALALCAGSAQAIGASDPRGDFVPGFAGSRAGDLDVIGAFVTYDVATDEFVFSGTLDASIGTTPGAFYVFGVDRGAGTAGFAANGRTGVLFDSVVSLRQDGSGTVSRLSGVGAGSTPLPAGTVLIVGSTFVAKVGGALLPSNGFAKTAYTWNLWPRDATLPAGFAQISDFEPDNVDAPVTVLGAVPEAAAAAMMGAGVLALLVFRYQRHDR
jgi:hypothetical protein